MSTSKKPPAVPLILQQNKKKESYRKTPPYQIGADTYDRYINRKNPFLERVLAGEPVPSQLDTEKAQALFQYFRDQKQYRLAFPTEQVPHKKRKIIKPQSAPPKEGEFVRSETLKEDLNRLRPSIQTFFKHILDRLENDLNELSLIVNELVPLFIEHRIRIKIYDAYQTFYSGDQFLAALKKISEDDDLENFEFFCSALFGYYSQFQ
ncbi:MAG: hypothetical protein HQM13_16160 [SAR324 cluster bacterium]|nr:hypothetical protein [SAR324 cluster bacterium]